MYKEVDRVIFAAVEDRFSTNTGIVYPSGTASVEGCPVKFRNYASCNSLRNHALTFFKELRFIQSWLLLFNEGYSFYVIMIKRFYF